MRFKAVIPLIVSLLVSIPSAGAAAAPLDPGAREVYARLPVEVQLLIADLKLDALIKEASEAGTAAKARPLGEAKASLKEALRRYEFFRTGDQAVLSADWGFSWAPPRPDYPSVTKSPLSLLEHLWIGYDTTVQMRAGIMVAAVPYSAAEAERHTSLDGSVEMMRKAAAAVESCGVWIVHWLSDARVMISAPPEFKRASPMKDDLVRLVKSAPDGSALGIVFVTRAYLERDEMEMRPEPFREKRVEQARRRFPDMSVVELGESSAGAGDFTTSFTYQYAWEGAPIKALVHIRRDGSSVYEINCVSIASGFDRAEADRIIGSFLKL